MIDIALTCLLIHPFWPFILPTPFSGAVYASTFQVVAPIGLSSILPQHSQPLTSTMPADVVSSSTLRSSSKSSPSTTSDPSKSNVPSKGKVWKRVRKNRDKAEEDAVDPSKDSSTPLVAAHLGANVWQTLTSSRTYFALLLLRFLLIFATPATLEGTEFYDGVDTLAAALLPGVNSGGSDPLLAIPPPGLGDTNRTRSIVGAFVTSGIPYMGVNVICTRVLPLGCPAHWAGYFALFAPRVWMFFLTLITDVLLACTFAVYQGENAVYALQTYASTWTTLLAMTRNTNFALETICVTALVAACFGWKPNVARPVFWLSSAAMSLGIFLRPPFSLFVFTPVIYLASLWGKSGIEPLRYVRASMEGLAIFGMLCSVWVSIDSVYFGTFKLRFGDTVMESFDMFVDHMTKGLKFSYKGSLVYTPLNALRLVANRQFFTTLRENTSPGQMFLSLPAILGPLFFVLIRESYDGMKLAMKDLMSELKQVANSKKPKKRKTKKAGMTKELEDELYVYYDTVQTTFLLGLLIEVLQNHNRLGTLSLLSLIPVCVVCIAGRIFGPNAFPRLRMLHVVFTVGMVVFFGFLNQSGIPRVMLRVGAGGVESIPLNADLIVYKGIIGHRSLLGANMKNVSFHDGGESRLSLMTKLRDIKSQEEYDEKRMLVLAAATVDMKDNEFELVETVAYGHMSVSDLPNNIDDAVRKSKLRMYRFVGDEDEAILRDDEEAAELEEMEEDEKRAKAEEKRRKARIAKEDL